MYIFISSLNTSLCFFPLLCNILCILNVNFMIPTTTITAVPQYAGVSSQCSSTGYYYTLCFQVIAYKQTGNRDNILTVRESFRLKLSIKNIFLLFSSTIQFPWQTWPKTNTPTLEVTFLLSGECLRTHTLSSFYLKRKRLDKSICQVNQLVCKQYLLSRLQPDRFLGPLLAAVVRTHRQSLR